MVDAESQQLVEDPDAEDKSSSRYFLSQRPILINLGIMMTVWLITSFNYYLI